MFHCNGWGFIWGMALVVGTNIILRNVETRAIYDAIVKHKVTHLCGAPIVLNMIANASPQDKQPLPGVVHTYTGGAPPPPSVLTSMESQASLSLFPGVPNHPLLAQNLNSVKSG